MNFLLGRPIFRGYVSFREGIYIYMYVYDTFVYLCISDNLWLWGFSRWFTCNCIIHLPFLEETCCFLYGLTIRISICGYKCRRNEYATKGEIRFPVFWNAVRDFFKVHLLPAGPCLSATSLWHRPAFKSELIRKLKQVELFTPPSPQKRYLLLLSSVHVHLLHLVAHNWSG